MAPGRRTLPRSPGGRNKLSFNILPVSFFSFRVDFSQEPGNFGDPAGLNQYTLEMRNRELNNGRMAMFAAIGIIAANVYTGKDAIEQFGLA